MPAEFYLESVETTQEFAKHISQIAEPHTVLALSGQLGSGKTTLTKAIAKELQVKEFVVSPTFVTINEYHSGRLPLYHFDLYRYLDQNGQLHDFLTSQLEEILQTKSVVIIEWAQILVDRFNLDLNNLCQSGYLSLDLKIAANDDQARVITIKPIGKKDQLSHLLFSKLCDSSKKFLSK